jgi:uncharacterized protein (TIGR02246 family)
MKKRAGPIAILLLSFLSSPLTYANEDASEAAIGELIGQLSSAWRAGDGSAWADAFSDDAYFTVWFGMELEGKEQIEWGHQLIFDNFYANTTFDLEVRRIRFLGANAAVIYLSGSVVADGEPQPAEPDAVPIAIAERSDDGWKIVAFQNTPFVVNEFRTNGDLRRFKKLAGKYIEE